MRCDHLEAGDPLALSQLGGGAPGLVPEAAHRLAGGAGAVSVVKLPRRAAVVSAKIYCQLFLCSLATYKGFHC